MKKTVLSAFVILSLKTFSQDTLKIKQIDSLVKVINNSNFSIRRDTINQDKPEMGLSMKSYITLMTTDTELKKYINDVHAITQENGKPQKVDGGNIFYFDQNKLIKVEEFMTDGDSKAEIHWYYADEKLIYNTLTTEDGKERADMLLKMANGMIYGFKSAKQNPIAEYRQAPYSTDTLRVTKTYVATGFYLLTNKPDGIKMRLVQSDEVYTISPKPFVSVNNISHCSLKIDTTDHRILGSVILNFDEKGTQDYLKVMGNPLHPFIAVVIANRLFYVVENREKMTKGNATILIDGYSKKELEEMVNAVKRKK